MTSQITTFLDLYKYMTSIANIQVHKNIEKQNKLLSYIQHNSEFYASI
jgi:hypothetical protein